MSQFTTQFGKSTSLSALMTIGETSSATLASAVFTNFVGDYLVLDYNIPAKREVIKCSVTGTGISSITRGQQGTSAVEHSAGALVAYGFLPVHYDAIANKPYCKVIGSTTQSLNDTTNTIILWDTESSDTQSMHSTSVNTGRITVTIPGLYDIRASLRYAANGTGTRSIALKKNGSFLSGDRNTAAVATGSRSTSIQIIDTISLVANDYIEVSGWQDSGGALNVDLTNSYFSVYLLN